MRSRTRISLVVGLASVLISVVVGVALGLLAGFKGGWVDSFLMRLCDVMLSFPAILVALLIAGVGRALFPDAHESLAFGVLIIAISLTGWVQYARTVRGSTLVERNKEYVQAARVTGVPSLRIMVKHVLPNVMGPSGSRRACSPGPPRAAPLPMVATKASPSCCLMTLRKRMATARSWAAAWSARMRAT